MPDRPLRHAPEGYDCPFCALVERRSGVAATTFEEIVYEDDLTLAFVAFKGFGTRPGHLLVVPRGHFENLYDLPDEVGAALHQTARRMAIALVEATGCEGTSVRQHNEPAGNQDVWHYHAHVFPRWAGDDLYRSPRVGVELGARLELAARVRTALAPLPPTPFSPMGRRGL